MISVRDDGRGWTMRPSQRRPGASGLLAAGEQPSIERLNNLIFRSGFSTKQASARSRAGVWVWTWWPAKSRQKGTIDLQTEPGRGTRLTVRLPARLALETTMIVRVGGQAFALPVAQIEHAQPFEPSPSRPRSRPRRQAGFVMFRERRIPMIHARDLLGIASTPPRHGLSFL